MLAAAVALTEPEVIIIGGSWGSHPLILQAISTAAARLPRPVPVQAAQLAVEPSLAGARAEALTRLRSDIVAASRRPNFRRFILNGSSSCRSGMAQLPGICAMP